MIIQLTLSMVFILHIAIWNSLVPAKKKIQLWLTWYKHIILVINCVLFTSLFCGFRPIDQSSGGCVCVCVFTNVLIFNQLAEINFNFFQLTNFLSIDFRIHFLWLDRFLILPLSPSLSLSLWDSGNNTICYIVSMIMIIIPFSIGK